MNTKDILLVGVGVVAGYLLVTYMNKSKATAQSALQANAEQAKIDKCNQAVADYMATAKFVQGADLEAMKKAKFDACMAETV